MSYTYAEKKRAQTAAPPQAQVSQEAQGPSLEALKSGLAAPTREQLGRQVDLPGAIRSKMEAAFGADLSAVKLYESQTVADAGAQAVAQGSRVAFAPGVLDLASQSGQALLGHELSHVVSQSRGEVSGSGYLNDQALEARADREGAMAAAGDQIYTGPVSAPLSSASAAPAAGPMQAKKYDDEVRDMALWSARGGAGALQEKERMELDSKLTSMLQTPKQRQKFASEYMKQKVNAAKKLVKARDRNVAKYGPERGMMETKYSKEAMDLQSYADLSQRISCVDDADLGYRANMEIARQSQELTKKDGKTMQILQEARDIEGKKLNRDAYEGGPAAYDNRLRELWDQMQVNRISGYNSHVPMVYSRPGAISNKKFASQRNVAIDQMVRNATPEQMKDPLLQKMVLEAFNGAMSSRLKSSNRVSKEESAGVFRGGELGELGTYNAMLTGLSKPLLEQLGQTDAQGGMDEDIDAITGMLEGDPSLKQMISGAKEAFNGSVHFADDDSQSEMLMNNYMLRVLGPHFMGAKSMEYSRAIQATINRNMSGASQASGQQPNRSARRFLEFGKRLWQRNG